MKPRYRRVAHAKSSGDLDHEDDLVHFAENDATGLQHAAASPDPILGAAADSEKRSRSSLFRLADGLDFPRLAIQRAANQQKDTRGVETASLIGHGVRGRLAEDDLVHFAENDATGLQHAAASPDPILGAAADSEKRSRSSLFRFIAAAELTQHGSADVPAP